MIVANLIFLKPREFNKVILGKAKYDGVLLARYWQSVVHHF